MKVAEEAQVGTSSQVGTFPGSLGTWGGGRRDGEWIGSGLGVWEVRRGENGNGLEWLLLALTGSKEKQRDNLVTCYLVRFRWCGDVG